MDEAARESGAGDDVAAVPDVPARPGTAQPPPWTGLIEHRTDLRGLLRPARTAPAGVTPTPGEAMALASSAMRLVEAQLVGSGSAAVAAADLSTARAALREARELLDAAAAGLPGEPLNAPRRLRSRLGLARQRPDRR